MTTEYTNTLRLAKPEFRSPLWGPLMNANMDAIDAGITNAILASNIVVWDNEIAYTVGTIAMDDQVSPPTYWICSVEHTSPASPTTFATHRAANPTYWSSITFGINPRGEWDNETAYGFYDIAYDSTQGIVGLCLVPHTSSASPNTIDDDAANWVFIIDLPSVGTTPASNISYDNSSAAIPNSPANVQDAIDELDARIDNAATVVSGIITDLDAAEATIVTHTSQIASLSSRMTTAENDITALEATASDHETRIGDLETEVALLGAGFPTGTAMLFWQAAAPTGWTKSTTHNDKALRVVSGTGGGNAGTNSFSSVFSNTTTGATTLTTSTIPAHTHSYEDYSGGVGAGGDLQNGATSTINAGSPTGRTSGSTGSGGSHTHPMDIRVQYLDVIICTKDA